MPIQQVYLQFPSIVQLKAFRNSLPAKKVFILLGQNVLYAAFTEKEIRLAVEKFSAEIISMPVA